MNGAFRHSTEEKREMVVEDATFPLRLGRNQQSLPPPPCLPFCWPVSNHSAFGLAGLGKSHWRRRPGIAASAPNPTYDVLSLNAHQLNGAVSALRRLIVNQWSCQTLPLGRSFHRATVRGILLWLLGIPIPIIILLYIFHVI